jgi:hypothetical protein
MLLLLQWRYCVSEDTPPGVKFSFLDYVALGFILPGAEELLRRPMTGWPIYAPALVLGLVALAFRDRSPQLIAWMTSVFLSPKKLRSALIEIETLKQQLSDAQAAAQTKSSKLIIQSADYRAIAQGGNTCDVTECLRKMINGDTLILQIENHNFVVDGKNYVPEDPFYGQFKRLRVTYYFDGGSPVVIERPEHARIVLPEDTFLHGQVSEFQKQLQQVKAEGVSFAVNGVLLAGPAAHAEERARLEAAREPLGSLFSPLQIEILRLSKDLQKLRRDAEPSPELKNAGPMKNGEDSRTWTVQKLIETHVWSNEYAVWARKFIYSYEAQFADRVRNIMTSIGQTTGLVVFPLKPYTETIRPGDDFQNLLDILMDFFIRIENPKKMVIPSFENLIPIQSNSPLLSDLQRDAIQLRNELLFFLKDAGPEPVCDTSNCNNDPHLNAVALTEYHDAVVPWRNRLRANYVLKFKEQGVKLYHRFSAGGMTDQRFGTLADGASSLAEMQELAALLWTIAGKIGVQDGKEG